MAGISIAPIAISTLLAHAPIYHTDKPEPEPEPETASEPEAPPMSTESLEAIEVETEESAAVATEPEFITIEQLPGVGESLLVALAIVPAVAMALKSKFG